MVIMDDGIRLHAKLDMPPGGAEKCPLVIVIHGFTGDMEQRHITAVSETLNAIGCATLRVDMYGHGCSDGEFRDHTLYKWISNALTVIDYARTLDFVTDLYLCGHSQGGLIVMLAAALKHEVIRGLIPLSPGIVMPECARRGELLGIPFDPDNIPEEISFPEGRILGGNYIRIAQTIHVEEAIDRFPGPVLLIHGDEDDLVPVEESLEAARRYRQCQLNVIPGETHHFDRFPDQMKAIIQDWLEGSANRI